MVWFYICLIYHIILPNTHCYLKRNLKVILLVTGTQKGNFSSAYFQINSPPPFFTNHCNIFRAMFRAILLLEMYYWYSSDVQGSFSVKLTNTMYPGQGTASWLIGTQLKVKGRLFYLSCKTAFLRKVSWFSFNLLKNIIL